MIKKIIYAVFFLIIAAGVIGYYMWNKPHKNIAAAKEDYAISAEDFYKEYSANEVASNSKYLNKVISVSGKIVEIQLENPDEPTLALKTAEEGMTVSCGFNKEWLKELKSLKIGNTIKIKGKCDGLGMFGIVITQCNLEK